MTTAGEASKAARRVRAFTGAYGVPVAREFDASGLAPLAIGADDGLTVLRLRSFILSPEGQAILARHGFTAPTSPGGSAARPGAGKPGEEAQS